MIVRCDTLTQAFEQLEGGELVGASTIVVSRSSWDALSSNERDIYRIRADRIGIDLWVDDAISSHFVEVRGGDEAPPLSTERHV
jgi:hypothetical protein